MIELLVLVLGVLPTTDDELALVLGAAPTALSVEPAWMVATSDALFVGEPGQEALPGGRADVADRRSDVVAG